MEEVRFDKRPERIEILTGVNNNPWSHHGRMGSVSGSKKPNLDQQRIVDKNFDTAFTGIRELSRQIGILQNMLRTNKHIDLPGMLKLVQENKTQAEERSLMMGYV